MHVDKSEIETYLSEVFKAVNEGRYQIAARPKNRQIYTDYIFTEEAAKEVILSLKKEDFSEKVQNEHPKYRSEILYIFGKDVWMIPRYGEEPEKVSLYIKFNQLANHYVVVISFHKQEYPLSYRFR